MYLIFLAVSLLTGCSHQARIEKLEKEVRRLKSEISELEADVALLESTPAEPERKKERRVKK